MTDRGTIEGVIDRCYAARQKGDIETLMATFDPDAVFELAGSKELLDVAGVMRGHQNIRTAMTGFIATFEFTRREIISIVTDGERATVHSRLTVRFVPRNTTFTSELVDLFRFRGRKNRRVAGVCRYGADQGCNFRRLNYAGFSSGG